MSVTVFSTQWCGYCVRLKRALAGAGIPFSEIDLEEDPQHAARIEAVTGGFRTVPAVEIGEHLLVNPTLDQVRAALDT